MTTKKKTSTSKTTSAKKAPAKKVETTAKKTPKVAAAEPAAVVTESLPKALETPVTAKETVAAAHEVSPAVAEAPKAPVSVTVETATAAPAEKPVLTIGMLQKRLYELGFYNGHWDGHYGPMTKEAVGHFQYRNGLHADGNATPETLAALGF